MNTTTMRKMSIKFEKVITMAQIEIKEKRTTKHDIAIKGVLAVDSESRLVLVQVNDYGEVIAEKLLSDALANFVNAEVKIVVSELEPEVEEVQHDINYLIEA